MNLQTASVIGYFSLPGKSLAEANPEAYRLAMADAPAGAGTCAHCGTGILHHVIVALEDGTRAFIGTDCALRVGSPMVQRCVRAKATTETLVKQDVDRDLRNAAMTARETQLKAIGASLTDLADRLHDGRNGFRDSIAADMRRGVLPTGRGVRITVDILARMVGRFNSAAYWDEFERVEQRLREAAVLVDALYT